MKIISHRANLYGPDSSRENKIESINECLFLGFDVEIDVWKIKDKLFLGHDEPLQNIELEFLINKKLWCHAKNLEALNFMLNYDINCFWHENDKYTITSKNIIWTFPNNELTENSVCVLPEIQQVDLQALKRAYGICTDYCIKFKDII